MNLFRGILGENMELIIDSVTKQYKDKKALDRFSLKMTAGVYGLLGPNGAGKSTLIGVITGLVKQDSGSVSYKSKSGLPLCARLGYLPQYQSFYKNYTAEEFLRYIMALKGIKTENSKSYCRRLLEQVNLADCGGKKIGAFSGGMKQRLGIAQALVGEPEVLIFDEPTAGLDPKERIRFRNLISSLGSDRIVILATHIVSDIAYIAKEVVLINNGRLIDIGTQSQITSKLKGKVWEYACDSDSVIELMNAHPVSNVIAEGNLCRVRLICEHKPFENAVDVSPNLDDVCLYSFGEI